jgi:hypothetical protein
MRETLTATEKYRAVNEGSLTEGEFVRQMRLAHPTLINQYSMYKDTVSTLKQHSLVFESKLDSDIPQNVSDDSLRRALDIELTVMGHDPVTCSDGEAQDKARDIAIKNLKKDPLHYYNLLAKESSKVDKNDKMKETKVGAKDVDTFNGMKNAALKEGYTESQIHTAIENIKEKTAAYMDEDQYDDLTADDTDLPTPELKTYVAKMYRAIEKGASIQQVDKMIVGLGKLQNKAGIKEIEGNQDGDDEALSPEELANKHAGSPMKEKVDITTEDKRSILQDAIDAITSKYDGIHGLTGQIKSFLEMHSQDIIDGADPVEEFNNYIDINFDSLDETDAYDNDEETQDMIDQMRRDGKDAEDFVDEKKGTDHDKDGDIDGDDYKHAKDKAIKKAMGKDEGMTKALKENVKAIITKVLEEDQINEAATNVLAAFGEEYAGFDGMKQAINQLENIVTDIEQYYDKTRSKIQKIYDTLGEIRNEEGLKVGGFLAPAVEQAFNRDLRPVIKIGFTKGLDTPKVKTISNADFAAARERGEIDEFTEEAPKKSVFTPVYESKKKK